MKTRSHKTRTHTFRAPFLTVAQNWKTKTASPIHWGVKIKIIVVYPDDAMRLVVRSKELLKSLLVSEGSQT